MEFEMEFEMKMESEIEVELKLERVGYGIKSHECSHWKYSMIRYNILFAK